MPVWHGHTRAGDTWPVYVSRMWRCASMGVSTREGEYQDSLPCRFQRMMQMSGILRETKSHRHFLCEDYEIKRKEH
jgi:ribosomal protein S21